MGEFNFCYNRFFNLLNAETKVTFFAGFKFGFTKTLVLRNRQF